MTEARKDKYTKLCVLSGGHWSMPSRISNRQSVFDSSLFLWFYHLKKFISFFSSCCFYIFGFNMMNGLTIDLMSHADIMLPFEGHKKWFEVLSKRTTTVNIVQFL